MIVLKVKEDFQIHALLKCPVTSNCSNTAISQMVMHECMVDLSVASRVMAAKHGYVNMACSSCAVLLAAAAIMATAVSAALANSGAMLGTASPMTCHQLD